MSIKFVIKEEISIILASLIKAKSDLALPNDYLKHIIKNKYENPKFTDTDWEIVEKESDKLQIINKNLEEAIDVVKRFKEKIEILYNMI